MTIGGVVQVVIDESTDKSINGVYAFDRDSGGILEIPHGNSFPGTPEANEVFWRDDESKLYKRNAGNTTWEALAADVSTHALGGASHSSSTLAQLNAKISDATLDNSSDPRDPNAHASSHQNGGGDEISVAGLSGVLADDQNPAAHASDHEPGGGDAMAVDAATGTGSLRTLGTGAQQACAGDDSRLSDARTPTAHASTHASGGSDSVKLDDLASPDDNTDLNATTGAHGLLPKLGGGTTNFLRADGSWAAPASGGTTPEVFASNESAGGQTVGDWPPTDITFDDDFQNSDPTLFSWANDSELTVNTAGKLYVVCKLSIQQTAGSGRTISVGMLMRKTAAGTYDYLWGSKGYLYTRNSSDGAYGSIVCALGFTVAAGDVVKMVGWRDSGTGTLAVVADASTLNVLWAPA